MTRRENWPITLADVRAARARIREHLPPTPLRSYGELDDAVGHGIRVWVKHENHNPTNSFKVRNAVSVLTTLSPAERKAGVVAGTRGNHGQGLAWAGRELGIPVTIVVPEGNNPEKNAAMIALGAELIISGKDYDDTVPVAQQLHDERGMRIVHSTNDPGVLAGAATLSLEMFEERPEIDTVVVSVGGGSQAVGAMTVARELAPSVEVHGVQAAAAPALHDSWHAGRPLTAPVQPTIADGLATRETYPVTFPALQAGLASLVTVTEREIAAAIRLFLSTTHNLAEGAGATGLAGLTAQAEKFAGKTVGLFLGGANIDTATLKRVLTGDLSEGA